MPSFEELLKAKNKRLLSIPLKLQTVVQKQQNEVLNGIISKLNELSVKGGRYEITNENLKVIGLIDIELKEVLLNDDYLKAVKQFTKEFDKQALINNDLIKSGFGEVETPISSQAYINNAKKGAIKALTGNSFDAEIVAPLQTILENAVVNGASYSETLEAVSNFIKGTDESVSQLLKYSKQITNDTFSIADRSYTSIVSDYLESEWFYYSGTEVATTRCFCAERVGNYYHYKEIESWGNGENLGECNIGGGQWAGEIVGTNSATIYSFLGGYNCLHSLTPVSEFIVPESDKERTRNLGYIE